MSIVPNGWRAGPCARAQSWGAKPPSRGARAQLTCGSRSTGTDIQYFIPRTVIAKQSIWGSTSQEEIETQREKWETYDHCRFFRLLKNSSHPDHRQNFLNRKPDYIPVWHFCQHVWIFAAICFADLRARILVYNSELLLCSQLYPHIERK